MNAESYLRKQGWKGSGHSLDTTGRGIKKPLLIAHKQDQLGLGKKKAAWTTDDQWWMRAFDQSLQSIGTGQESTLSQIRTKGINRGGLYGFFVKGEAIAGTIDDSSASATDASIPPSRASTPLTSASDSDAPAAAKMSDKKNKRKRQKEPTIEEVKKAKKSHLKSGKKDKTSSIAASSKDQAAVSRKIAKLTSKKKAMYEKRAAEKKQSLNDYILRRVQKKAAKRANRYDETAPPAPFFTDLEGDATLVNQVTAIAADEAVLGAAQEISAETEPTLDAFPPEQPEIGAQKEKTTNNSLPSGKNSWKIAVREKRKLAKERKQARKAEKRPKSRSKFGNQENSRWAKDKVKMRKAAAKQKEK